jgi:hypothetical protein
LITALKIWQVHPERDQSSCVSLREGRGVKTRLSMPGKRSEANE